METIDRYETILSPKGCGITFYTESRLPFGDENILYSTLSFHFENGDLRFYSDSGVAFVFKGGSYNSLIQSLKTNEPITLIGVDKQSGMIVVDIDGHFCEKH